MSPRGAHWIRTARTGTADWQCAYDCRRASYRAAVAAALRAVFSPTSTLHRPISQSIPSARGGQAPIQVGLHRPTMLRMIMPNAGATPQHAARLLLRAPCSLGHRRVLLHSARAYGRGSPVATRAGAKNAEGVANQPGPKPCSGGLAAGRGLPAWVPCSGSVTMVVRTVARGFRSGAATSRAVSTGEATPATAAKLYLGYAPRVWAMGAGHCAFVMLASMYLMTDMVLLRVLGIVANAFDMLYADAPDLPVLSVSRSLCPDFCGRLRMTRPFLLIHLGG